MKIYMMLHKYIKKYVVHLLLFIIFSLVLWMISMVVPYISGKLIDGLTTVTGRENIYNLIKALILLGLFEIVITYFQNILITELKTKIGFDLNFSVLEYIKKLPLEYFNKYNSTYLNQRINNDSLNITNFILDNSVNIAIKICSSLFILVYIFRVSIRIGLALMVLIPLEILLYNGFRKPLYEKGYEFKEEQNKFFSKMNEQLYNIRLVKMNCWYALLGKELMEKFKNLFSSAMKYAKLSFLYSNIDLTIGKIATIFIYSYGGIEVLNKRLTVGTFIIINSYFIILLSCISYLINLGKSYQDTLVCYNRIREILDIRQEHNGDVYTEAINDIQLVNVNFSYEDKQILKDFNYKFESGNIYCIVGENGCGKSTFVNIITGLLNNYTGNIYYNDYNMKDLDLYRIRKNLVGVTEQEPILINDTIRNNITYGLDNVDNEEIYKWCKTVKIDEFISDLPEKIDTVITERASNISGGEKQKISLIRTFIKKPKILILDEPSSALDRDSIIALKAALKKIKNDRIIILITHDDTVIDVADHVIRFEQIGIIK